MKEILSKIPEPLLRRGVQVLQDALKEKEEKAKKTDVIKSKLNLQSFSRVVAKDMVSLDEIIEWAKSHYPENEDLSFVVIKDKSDKLEYDYLLYFIYTKDGKPLLDSIHSSLALYAKKMDTKLVETFDNNDIIEFE